jgi:hypothetical protein
MTDKIDPTLRDQLAATVDAALSDRSESIKKAVRSIADDIESDLMYRVQDDMAANLTDWVAQMAERAVEQMLAGNEDQMRRYLSCDKRGPDGQYLCYTGRSDGMYAREKPEACHPVIHGRLFEQGALELRKKIVDAHRELLVDERIRDLEDQVKSLVAQVNKAVEEKERLWERVRNREFA